jgi:hypothetical protein
MNIGTLINVIEKPGTFDGLAMYYPNSNWIFVTKVDLHMVVNRLLKDSWLEMQAMTLNMAIMFRAL